MPRHSWLGQTVLALGAAWGAALLLPWTLQQFGPAAGAAAAALAVLAAALLFPTLRLRSLRREARALTGQMGRVAQGGSLELRLPDAGGELDGLSRSINTMLRRHGEAEAELKASTALASSIIATAYDAYVEIDEAGRVTDWNRQAEITFGWPRAEALGQLLGDLIVPPRYRAAHRDGLRRYLQGGAPRVLNRRLEMAALTREGHEFPVELSIWATPAGVERRFSAFLRDISERNRMLQRLAAQSAATSVLVGAVTLDEAAPAVLEAIGTALGLDLGLLWLVDEAGAALDCAGLWRRFGLDLPQFEARSRASRFGPGVGLPGRVWSSGQPAWVFDVTADASMPRAPAAEQDGLLSGFAFPVCGDTQVLGVVEFFSRTRQAADPDLLKMMTTFGSLLGQFIGRKRAEALLDKERLFLNVALENLADGIVACDERGVLSVFNRATREFHGLPEEPLPAERWAEHYDLYEADGHTRLETAQIPLFRAFQGETVRDAQIVIAPRGRPPRTMLCNGRSLTDQAGRKLGAVVAMHDITQSQRAAAELAARADELARSNEELERFAYIASHDLQEPLRTVASYTQLLARRARAGTAEEQQFAGYITDAVHRMRALIEGLLSYSRVSQPEHPGDAADLSRLVDSAVANLQETVERNGAHIRCEPLPQLKVNAPQIVQLFQNLIGNAIKFRGEAAPQVQIAAQREGSQWIFSVRDNGIGIDAAHRERIFTLFQRLHTSDAYPGSGIGLALCKRIVERHGGRIWVEGQASGSEFRFSLPA